MRRKERAEVFGSEEQKQRKEHEVRNTAVLDPEENGQDQAVEAVAVAEIPLRADGRPPKPSEDAVECPNWEKGRLRSNPYFRCQGNALNGNETCRNCYRFQQEAPIFRAVSLETVTRVISNARRSLEGVVDPFKETRFFNEAWEKFASVVEATKGQHESRGRDYSSQMREIESLVPSVFAEEARRLLSKCESLAVRQNGDADRVYSAFHEWEAQVKVETEQADINGVYPHWIFAGLLRHFYRALSRVDALNDLAGSIRQGPRRNGNGGNGGWNTGKWRPDRGGSPPTWFGTDRRHCL